MPIDPSIPLQAQAPPRPSPAELLGQVLQIKRLNQQQQVIDLELQEKKRAAAAEDAINNAMSNAIRKDGTVDIEKLGQGFIGTPGAGAFPKVAKSIGEVEEQKAKALKARLEAKMLEADYAGALATAADTAEDPEDKAALLAAMFGSGISSGLLDMKEMAPILSKGLNDDGTPHPENVQGVIRLIQARSKEQRDLFSRELSAQAQSSNAQVNREQFDVHRPELEAEAAIKQEVAAGMRGGLTPNEQRQASQEAARLALARQTEAREASIAAARLALDREKEKREAATAKATGGGKLAAAAIEKIAGIDQSLSIANNLEKLVSDDWLGPAAGRYAKAKIATPGVPVPGDLARFAADSATLKNSVIKAITGAQMSEPEAKRIGEQIPDFTDKPNVWREKLAATRDNLKVLKKRTIELSGGTYDPKEDTNLRVLSIEKVQ